MNKLYLNEYAKQIEALKRKAQSVLAEAGIQCNVENTEKSSIRLVFAGQYSAGKSSILKMMTNRDDIDIGAGITTQSTHSYNWNGIEVVDTPGIHTDLRPDHDEISYEAIASADMLIFVVTNELFDSHIAEHFRKLAIDKDKGGEMVLVVNKMERAADGNSLSQQNVIREDLRKVLNPYTPEQVHLTFLDAESYLDSLTERETDKALADALVERSGYNTFIETLNQFVQEKSISSKLTTDLYIIEDQLDKAIKDMQPKSNDPDIDALEEKFRQHKYLLIQTRNNMQREIKDIYLSAASKIREVGLNAADLIKEGCQKDDVEQKLKDYVNQVEDIINKCQENIDKLLDTRFDEMKQSFERIEDSEFSQTLNARLNGKFDSLPESLQKILSGSTDKMHQAGTKILNNAYNKGAKGGMNLSNFSGSNIHTMVLKVGHGVGYKFKPYQAIKITKGIAITGQILIALGIALSVFMQIKSDLDEAEIHENLRKNRQNIRSQFNAEANNFEAYASRNINNVITVPFEKAIAEVDEKIEKIQETRTGRNCLCRSMEDVQKECRLLIQHIHEEVAQRN